ncbi:MAG: hypothetical protein U1E05_01775 [Patescibacteria group bacterium]|nr:hypothetical protein [Patescibacteria group bacterium]
MQDHERQLLDLAKEFISIQQSLLAAWREANPSSRDLEMLLDYPKNCPVRLDADQWAAARHGLGVRFVRTDGLTVDVPYGIAKPLSLDANRLFDFVTSKPLHLSALLPRDRQSFYVLFDRLCESGHIVSESDSAGQSLFTIRSIETGPAGKDPTCKEGTGRLCP